MSGAGVSEVYLDHCGVSAYYAQVIASLDFLSVAGLPKQVGDLKPLSLRQCGH